ncbi:MAG: LAGLIDADG family homing endonuclease [Candidatus Liptonbacteria bacterium]|nr:LAGLIDADG family homing endonuclease [Candidatus Liptonbacteria bacterium]
MIQDKKLSYEFIRGFVESKGTFTFSSNNKIRRKIPAFAIKTSVRNRDLLEKIKDSMGLENRIYEYNHQRNDGYKRSPQAMLIVREFGQLKNIVVPFFYKKLKGDKGKQFEQWLEKIGSDPEIPKTFRFIYKIYKAGFYDKNPKFLD